MHLPQPVVGVVVVGDEPAAVVGGLDDAGRRRDVIVELDPAPVLRADHIDLASRITKSNQRDAVAEAIDDLGERAVIDKDELGPILEQEVPAVPVPGDPRLVETRGRRGVLEDRVRVARAR